MSDLKEDMRQLESRYTELFEAHGDTPAAVQQSDRATQEVRMRRLCEIADVSTTRILDFGCGSGHLLKVLRDEFGFTGSYVGYDLSEPHLAAAKNKFPSARFERRDILQEGVGERFNYVMINGVFNNLISDNWTFITSVLRLLHSAAIDGIAFNCLSTYVDYHDVGLYYVEPMRVFDFCKRVLSPFVCLRHDYRIKRDVIPYEFTVYVYRNR
jgi:SAM-dependent methyltransferase